MFCPVGKGGGGPASGHKKGEEAEASFPFAWSYREALSLHGAPPGRCGGCLRPGAEEYASAQYAVSLTYP